MSTSTEDKITRPSIKDAYGSLTWFDEQDIEKNLSVDIHDLMESFVSETAGLGGVVKLIRAFEFIAAQREGRKPAEALEAVRSLTAGQIDDIAAAYLDSQDELESEVDVEQPITPAGEGDAAQ